MKKFIVAISAILYLSTTSGATIHLRYCMNKLIGWGLLPRHERYCSKCGMDKSLKHTKGCCKDEKKLVKLSGDQNIPEVCQIVHADSALPIINCSDIPVFFKSSTKCSSLIHAPPGSMGVPLYIENRVFRI